MKCATGIQPSPHNSPIYDWAKLLSMRRIKSRARVREKSAGRRDATGRAATRRRFSRSRSRSSPEKRGAAGAAHPVTRFPLPDGPLIGQTQPCTTTLHDPRASALFSVQFFTRSRATEIQEKLNIVHRARARSRGAPIAPPARPIAARPVSTSSSINNPTLNDRAILCQLSC